MDNPGVVLVGRYPALLEYLQAMLQQVFSHYHISSGVARKWSTQKPAADLLILVQDRSTPLDLDALSRWSATSRLCYGVLVLSEQPDLLPPTLPGGLLVRDLAIDADELRQLVLEINANSDTVGPGSRHRSSSRPGCRFTSKERQVLGHLSNGLSNKVIAQRMHLTESTVKYHMRKLFIKTGCRSRIQRALMARQVVKVPKQVNVL